MTMRKISIALTALCCVAAFSVAGCNKNDDTTCSDSAKGGACCKDGAKASDCKAGAKASECPAGAKKDTTPAAK
jgi:hypothetical protein